MESERPEVKHAPSYTPLFTFHDWGRVCNVDGWETERE